MMKTLRNMVVVVGLLALLVPPASAQFAETTGLIQGTIRDSSGGVIPGAEVELAGETGAGKTQTTDRLGFFRFAQLTAGKYTLTVTAAGFKKYIEKDILLDTGKKLTFDVEMQVGEVAAIVEVTSAPENIDVTSSKSQVTVTTTQINLAPKPRGVLDLVQWAPGARAEPASAAGGFQIDGASASENQYTIEGQDTTQIRTGTAGVNPPPDFFKEVQVKSGGFEAENGGAMGGLVNLSVKGGGPEWHGAGILYFRHSGMNAGDRHFNRLTPGVSLSSLPPRFSEPVQEYRPIEDTLRILEPGFQAGGPVWKDRIFLFTSYIPRLEKTSRVVNGTNPNSLGPRNWTRIENTHYAVGRVDGNVTSNLRAFALWDYAYARTVGTDRPNQDDVDGKSNATATTDANLRRPDRGQVLPNVLWRMGGDWTPTSKVVVAGAYGKWFVGSQDRGVPVGVRHIFASSNVNGVGLDGATVPAAFQNISGFADIPNNNQNLFDNYSRTQGNLDGSYTFHGGGTHTLKGGWSINKLANSVKQTTNTARVDFHWDEAVVQTGPYAAGCAPVVAFNVMTYGLASSAACRGNFGYYQIVDFQTRGSTSSDNQAFYFQDSWNVGWGVTINAGIRFEREFLPSFAGPGTGNPTSAQVVSKPIEFGYGDKTAPRIGVAWDVFRNGKLKLYGNWGWFYDIMKYELPRGSFGGDYWHNCDFTLDTADYTSIIPTVQSTGFTCNNGATGTLPGTFLGEEDLRIPSNTTQNIDNILDPGLQPARQTDLIIGGEWAWTREIGVSVRWAHRRIRNAIEDAGILTAAGEQFLIVNPGERIGEFPLRGDCATPGDPRCDNPLGISTLPAMPKARREYDAVEFRINKRFTGNWYINASYTWSRLFGNYSGLASSDEDLAQRVSGVGTTGGGRTSPNVNRMFDEQEITWNSFGEAEYGRLQTDRPHTLKAYGGYRFKYWGMESIFAVNQSWFMGTPRGTRMYFNDLDIPVYVYGRETFAEISQDATTGAWILDGLKKGKRTPMFSQTDLSFTHDFHLSKTNEALKLEFNFNALNLFNQGGIITYKDRAERSRINDVARLGPDPTCADPQGCASVSGLERHLFFDGFDPIAVQDNPLYSNSRLDTLYNLEARNQFPRELRLMVRVIF